MGDGNFLAELKRRNVYKVAVAYAVVSWLLIQIATQVFPFFEIPNWAVRLVVLALIIGFPVALILSWAFEITPEGIKRESEVGPNESITQHTGRKLVGITIVLAVMAAGLLAWQLLRSRVHSPMEGGARATPGAEARAGTSLSIPEKSIAVLPFDNLSDDKSNAYFTEGIQDEILTRLSKIAALKVISRTSTKKYQSAPDNLRDVGKQLGVAHVLEGSVQKISNAVHVNVQLIRADTDQHVWAETYNRKLDDVFAVEGEVAGAIAEKLNAHLTGAEVKAVSDKPTQNIAAYDAYLHGLTIEHDRYNYSAYQEAAANYARAVQLDPNFALAWARLGVIRSFLFFNGVDANTNSAAAVKEAADHAIALQPELGEAWVAQGAYRYRVLRDFHSALQAYNEGRKRLPNSSLVFEYLAYVERRLGLWQEAESHYQKAAELDPRDLQLLISMGSEFLNLLRRFDDAHAAMDRALEISPNDESALANKANLFQTEGRLTEAAQQLARIPPNPQDPFVVVVRSFQAIFERRFDDATAILKKQLQSLEPGKPLDDTSKIFLVTLGDVQEWAGRPNEARAMFERAIAAIKPSPESTVQADSLGLPYFLALAYAGLGEKEKALAQAKRAVSDYADDAVTRPVAEGTLAQIQARFGDLDSAIAAIPHLLEVPAGITPADLRLNPYWDPLRQDPRFQKFLIETPAPSK
jgi:TolB-like protein/lipoprotein NlpI